MKNILKNRWLRAGLFLTLGTIAGYSYYYFIGCTSGSCPITSNPYISTGYGMMIGLFLSLDSGRKKQKDGEN